MKKRRQLQSLKLKRATIVNLSNENNIKGGFKDFTGDSCFEVCNTDLRNCTWGGE